MAVRPRLPPPPLPPKHAVRFVQQNRRRARFDGLDRKPMPRVFHCVRRGHPESLCGVNPSVIRPVMRRRETLYEPAVWRIKYWEPADPGTEVSCPTCVAIIRRAFDALTRKPIRYRPHGIKERPTKPRNEWAYAKHDEFDAAGMTEE